MIQVGRSSLRGSGHKPSLCLGWFDLHIPPCEKGKRKKGAEINNHADKFKVKMGSLGVGRGK